MILVEPQRIRPDEGQREAESEIDARLNTLREQVTSRTNLEKIIEEFQLFSDLKARNMLPEDKLREMRQNITIDVTGSNRRRAFSISYRGKDPETVMNVANALTGSFIEINMDLMLKIAVLARKSLEEQLDDMRSKLVEVEAALKEFREKYMGELPEQLDANLRILGQLRITLSDREEDLREAKNRLSRLESDKEIRLMQLRIEEETRQQNLAARIPAANDANEESADPLVRLNQMKNQLATLLSKYTKRHPDVISLTKKIKDLEREIEEQKKTVSQLGDPTLGSEENTAIMSPEYQYAKIQIIQETDRMRRDLQLEIRGFEEELAGISANIEEYQTKVEDTPKREQELISIRRNQENMDDQYRALLDRYLQAELNESMERRAKGEQFRIVDNASLPKKPVSPNMKILLLFFTFAGLGTGGGIIILLDFLDSSFKRSEDIEEFLEIPVIATIPRVLMRKDAIVKKINLVLSIIFTLIAIGLFGGLVILSLKGPLYAMEIVNKFI